MCCLVLIGGVIGCGKSTLIKHIHDNKDDLLMEKYLTSEFHKTSFSDRNCFKKQKFLKLIFDDICSIEEQVELMKTLKGWRNFRIDLLMASEYFINNNIGSENKMFGPLSERSQSLFSKLEILNHSSKDDKAKIFFFIEDNFYYRSMRYDWFQIARRANLGFCEVFLTCPLSEAITRNASRGYQIPEQKIRMMMSAIEYPNPDKFKWEKYSIVYDSSKNFECDGLKDVIKIIIEATNNPAEMLMTREKVLAQSVCAKNVIHQADNILRKLTSKKISDLQEIKTNVEDDSIKEKTILIIDARQELLKLIKNGSVLLPDDLLDQLQKYGIQSIQKEYELVLRDLFEGICNEKTLTFNLKIPSPMIKQVSNSKEN